MENGRINLKIMRKINLKKIDHWIFDLDNTLYPAQTNLFDQIDHLMGQFISREFNLDLEEARKIQKGYYYKYGTTLRGLMNDHDVEPESFLKFVHNIDLSGLERADALIKALDALPQKKFIYTNASEEYALRVLEKLGVAGKFELIFDIHKANYRPKPEIQSYHEMADYFNIDLKKSVMVEDLAKNLTPAYKLGMITVWLEGKIEPLQEDDLKAIQDGNIDYKISNLPEWLLEISRKAE